MPELCSYDYAVVRVVPSVERGEFVNVGIILHAKAVELLAARIVLDEDRLRLLAPSVDIDAVRAHLDSMRRISAGGDDAGPIGQLSRSQRFHWLVSPRSTVIQTSPVHSGLCEDPHREVPQISARAASRSRSAVSSR